MQAVEFVRINATLNELVWPRIVRSSGCTWIRPRRADSRLHAKPAGLMLTLSGESHLTRFDDRRSSRHGIRKPRLALSIGTVIRANGWPACR